MSKTLPSLVCPIDGTAPVIIRPQVVGMSPDSVQWTCTADSSHNGIILASKSNGSSKGSKYGGWLADKLQELMDKGIPPFSRSFQLDDGGIYVQVLPAPHIATIGSAAGSAFNSAPIAAGMLAALYRTGATVGPNGQKFFQITGTFKVDHYEACNASTNNYAWYEPKELFDYLSLSLSQQPGGSPLAQIVVDLRTGARAPYIDPNGKGIGFTVRPQLLFTGGTFWAGLRIGARYEPQNNDPGYAICLGGAPWLQVVGCSDRNVLVAAFNGDPNNLITPTADANGLFWTMDNLGDAIDPFYGAGQGTSTPHWFMDCPATNHKNLLVCFGLFIGAWLDANNNFTSQRTAVVASNTTGYVKITTWAGINWYAAPGDPNNLAGGWANAVTSDANDDFDSDDATNTSGNFWRNDFIISAGSANELYITTDQVTAATDGATGPEDGPPRTTIGFTTIPTQTYYPIAISTQGYVYEYATYQSIKDNPQLRLALAIPGLSDAKATLDLWTPR